MKTLLAGIVLIIVLGVGGLLYRNVLEQTRHDVANEHACTLEAKICPDGTTVGRSGPNCEFATCAPPNVSLPEVKIAYALPPGYTVAAEQPGADGSPERAVFYEKLVGMSHHYISIYDYPIPAGKTANDVILENTRFEPADLQATDMSRFTPKIIGTRTFSEVQIERFEGTVTTDYFLPRAGDVLRFEVIEQSSADWMSPDFIPDNQPEHQALIHMLGTLEIQ